MWVCVCMCVCMYVCARACVRACVRVDVCVCKSNVHIYKVQFSLSQVHISYIPRESILAPAFGEKES